jgi:hypothetical protein
LLLGPAEITEIVAVPVPAAARFSVPGVTEHEGGCAVTGVTEQLSATVPANPLTDLPVSVHVLVVVVFASGVTDSVEGLAVNVKLPVVAPPPPMLPPDAAAIKLATSSEPSPVAWSYSEPTRYPASPPVRLPWPGVLLLHMDGVDATHPLTPDEATVTSWNAAGVDAASLYNSGLRLPCAAPILVFNSAAIPAIPGADADVPLNTVIWVPFDDDTQLPPPAAKQPRYPS